MAQQTAVDWLNDVLASKGIFFEYAILQEAKQMEMEKAIRDYNAGYDDAQCNHINDAENYANEIEYIQSKIDKIDSEIKAKQNNIADMLINGNTNSK
jgi:GTP-binding protein EngB required for normal cell division